MTNLSAAQKVDNSMKMPFKLKFVNKTYYIR